MTERQRRGAKQIAAELGFELIIVFVGVYLASALSDYQERQRQEAHRTQIRRALVTEIGSITTIAGRFEKQLTSFTSAIDEQTAAGKQPIPEPMLGGATVAHPMWQATLSSGGLDLFDVKTSIVLRDFTENSTMGLPRSTSSIACRCRSWCRKLECRHLNTTNQTAH